MKNGLSAISIPMLDEEMGRQVKGHVDSLTVPQGSLGRLEEWIIELAKMTGEAFPDISKPGVIVFAADHGITEEGVSAYPKEVTEQMALNFLNDGAAINVLSRAIDAYLEIVDIGIDADIEAPGLTSRKVRNGTRNFYKEEAMTKEEVNQALDIGYDRAEKMIARGVNCLILGEMGIGNTTSSTAIISIISGKSVESLVGQGTGLKSEGILHKRRIIEEAISLRNPNPDDPINILMNIGGFEIAGMAGAMLAAANNRIPILVDGFITTTAAVLANLTSGRAADYMFVGHRSAEPGHRAAIELLGKEPILDLGMRIGEGTGAALSYPILKAATLVNKEVATFESAGVSNK
ncbi:nicotinate-nucleotide--dimethylbenzimidazole phosphoribosyltransferase [Peribacillus frigoritolerans]|uniref:Nicotinate-nucleotide--dimethylbenzimidazole phosphoribosyltransferase n=1 Tax=Peribacillus castrilensis TaxID=2897690 RepID=A0AAW9NFZ6_9BACI|nr:nicotinate-nucleotide--dimethylbenzimidazole phosphoribosyltransferase [Peribacillus castrilensis]